MPHNRSNGSAQKCATICSTETRLICGPKASGLKIPLLNPELFMYLVDRDPSDYNQLSLKIYNKLSN